MAQAQMAPGRKKSARRTREKIRRLGSLTEAQAALGWGVILLLLALLGAIYLNQASRIATAGRRVQTLQKELSQLRRENAALEQQIAEAQSLEQLQREAVRLGFVPAEPGDIEYVIVEDYPVATATPTPEPTITQEPPQRMADAIWLVARQRIGNLIRGESREQ